MRLLKRFGLSLLLVQLYGLAEAQSFGTLWQVAGGYTAYQSLHSGIQLASDNNYGLFVLYRGQRGDDRYGNLYLQRWSRTGVPVWPASGIQLSPAPFDQSLQRILADGRGGCYVVWSERRQNGSNIFVQRFSGEGKPQWLYPTLVHQTVNQHTSMEVCTDYSSGIQIFWTENRIDRTAEMVQGQRLRPDGTKYWGLYGLQFQTVRGTVANLQVYPEPLGGAILFWEHFEKGSSWQLQGQKITSSGSVFWGATGVSVADHMGYSLRNSAVVADGFGGALAVYERLGNNTLGKDLWCVRITKAGGISFQQPVCTAAGDQMNPTAVKKGSSVLVSWEDNRASVASNDTLNDSIIVQVVRNDTKSDIYAQRIDLSTGLKSWDGAGLAVCTAPSEQYKPRFITSNIYGDQILVWEDKRNSVDPFNVNDAGIDLYAQKFDEEGFRIWPKDGLAVAYGRNNQRDFQLLTDEYGGCFVSYLEEKGGYTYPYIQHIQADGRAEYGLNGVQLTVPQTTRRPKLANPQMRAGHNQDLYLAWEDYRNGEKNADIYLQRFKSDGTPLWPNGGVAVCTAEGYQSVPELLPAVGGTYIGWLDRRNGQDENIYLQFVDTSGRSLWLAQGKPICTASRSQSALKLHAMPNERVLSLWTDARRFEENGFDLFLQLIDPKGNISYMEDGVPLCSNQADQTSLVATCADSGCSVAWMNEQAGVYSILFQRLDAQLYSVLPLPGLNLNTSTGSQRDPDLVQTLKGDTYLAWADDRLGRASQRILLQKINAAGQQAWTIDGLSPGAAGITQTNPKLVWQVDAGLVAAWLGQRADGSPNASLYLQRIDSEGRNLWNFSGIRLGENIRPNSIYQLAAERGHIWAAWADKQANGKHRIQLGVVREEDGQILQVYSPGPTTADEYHPEMALLPDNRIVLAWLEAHPQGGARLLLRSFQYRRW
jgi:hypothetical protein